MVGGEEKGKDSKNLLDVFLGKSNKGRDGLVMEANSRTAFRKGNWVMIPPYKGPAVDKTVNIELGNYDGFQLCNLENDIGQRMNLASQKPEKQQEMVMAFTVIRGDGNKNLEALEYK